MQPERERFRWGWIVGSAALGLILLAAAFAGSLLFHWSEVTTGIFTDMGSALFIAFLLFLIERRFTQRVADRVANAAEAAVDARTKEFGSRLEDLEAQLNAESEATAATQDGAVASISEEVSFETVSKALDVAERAGVIGSHGLTVLGSKYGPRLPVKFAYAPTPRTRGDGLVIDDGTVRRLTVEVIVSKRPGSIGRPVIEAEWTTDTTSADTGLDLAAQLRVRDRPAEAKAFDFPFALRELQNGLRMALEDRRLPIGQEKLTGQLVETLGDTWAITTRGLTNVKTGLFINSASLGFPVTPGVPRVTPLPPDGFDPDEWMYLIERMGQQPSRANW